MKKRNIFRLCFLSLIIIFGILSLISYRVSYSNTISTTDIQNSKKVLDDEEAWEFLDGAEMIDDDVIESIDAEDIQAYIDLEGLGAGDHEVEVQIDNNNPLVSYVVSNTLRIRVTEN